MLLSPDFSGLYTQPVIDQLDSLDGIRIGGRSVNNIIYVDDMVHIADSKDKLQRFVNRLHEKCREKGLDINKKKTEVI